MAALLKDALPWLGFLDTNLVDLHGRGILQGWSVEGPSPDIADIHELAHDVRLFGQALGHLAAGDELQILFDRLPADIPDEQFYEPQHLAAKLVVDEIRQNFINQGHWITASRLYLSHQFVSPFLQRLGLWMDGGEAGSSNADLVLRRFNTFRDASRGALKMQALTRQGLFADLLYRVTYTTDRIACPADGVSLASVIGSAERQVNGQYPMIDGWHLRPIVLITYPAQTTPQMLLPLLQYQGYLTVSCRYSALPPTRSKAKMQQDKKHWFAANTGGMLGIIRKALKMDRATLSPTIKKMIDAIEVAEGKADEGWPFGYSSIIAIVRDRDPKQADLRVHELLSILHNKGIMARLELAGAARAIQNTWPGHLILEKPEKLAQRHRLIITGFNFADVALPATYWQGDKPSLLTCSGTASIPFYLPARVDGLGHMLMVGPAGGGKSTLLSTIACSVLSQPHARVAWLDLDHSAFVLSRLLNAKYHDLGEADSEPLCPLMALDQPGGLEWLSMWFERLFKRRGDIQLNEGQAEDFQKALRTARLKGIRTLFELRAGIESGEFNRERIRAVLKELYTSYGHIFGKEPDLFAPVVPKLSSSNRVTIYELRGLTRLPSYIAAPAIELILYNIASSLDGAPTWILADEFWHLLGDEISARWVFDMIRTFRKLNGSFIGCTQSLTEIVKSPFCALLLENLPAKLFLPNHAARNSYVADLYNQIGVSPHEVTSIAGSQLGDFLYQSSAGSRQATCFLGPVGQAVCGATHITDVQRAREYLASGDDFRTRWLRESGIYLPTDTQAIAGGGADIITVGNGLDGALHDTGATAA